MFPARPKKWVVLAALLLCARSGKSDIDHEILSGSEGWSAALEQFFGSIDKDGDGQIEPAEALQYIDANFDSPDIRQDVKTAAQQMNTNLDGSDSDFTISREEVEAHLRKLLRGNKVTEWVKHSAQLPQYARAFKENSITSLDFPMLVADNGVTLETDLGVKSKLHREQLIRALKRVILGIGVPPSTPQVFQCYPVSCDSVALRWEQPEKLGQPPLHKYKLERQQTRLPGTSVPAATWEAASEEIDDEVTAWLDADLQVGRYRYRLTAWNAMGWSESSISDDCDTLNRSLPCPPEKCWDEQTCSKQELVAEPKAGLLIPGAMTNAWRLLYSFVGMLFVGLLVSMLFMSSQQRENAQACTRAVVQDALLRHFPGLQKMENGPTQQQQSHSSADSIQGWEQAAKAQSLPFEPPTALQAPHFGQLLHFDSNNSRSSGRDFTSEASSPRRRGVPYGPSSELLSSDMEGMRVSGDQRLTSLHLNLPRHQALQGEQEVLWLDSESMDASTSSVADVPPSPHPTGRHKCGFPGCERGLHPIFNPRAAMTSHYCSICQNVFCHHHTRYSPHGKLGSCGMESKCICKICHEELPRITQDRLEKTNKLQRSKKDAGQNTTSASLKPETQPPERSARPPLLRVPGRGGPAGSTDGSAASTSGELPPLPQPAVRTRSRSGSESWSRLRMVWRAVGKFQEAGRRRSR